MRNWLHDLSPIALGLLFLVAIVGPMAFATWILGRHRPVLDRSNDSLMNSTSTLVGGAFALLAAFIIVSQATASSHAHEVVRNEAAAAEAFATEARRLGPPLDGQLLLLTVDYLRLVVDDEWKLMPDSDRFSERADAAGDKLLTTLFASPQAPTGTAYDSRYELVVGSLDRLASSRALRLNSNRDPLPGVLWAALLVSAGLLCVVAVAFPAGERRWPKWIQVLAAGTLVATVLFVVFSLEQPYAGFLQIDTTPYEIAINELKAQR